MNELSESHQRRLSSCHQNIAIYLFRGIKSLIQSKSDGKSSVASGATKAGQTCNKSVPANDSFLIKHAELSTLKRVILF